jgi:hypothetical protein
VSARGDRPDWAERVFDLLVRAHPAAFRERFGAEMRQLFRDRRRDAADRGEGAARFWLDLAADALRSLPSQHLAAFAERRASPAPATPFQERVMVIRKLLGAFLVLLALGHIVFDVAHGHSHMGTLAMLMVALMFAAGALLLVYRRRRA